MYKDEKTKYYKILVICILLFIYGLYVITWFHESKSSEHNKLIHIDTPNQSHCINAITISEGINGIKVETKEFGELYLSNGTYIIIDSGVCPYCEPETTN